MRARDLTARLMALGTVAFCTVCLGPVILGPGVTAQSPSSTRALGFCRSASGRPLADADVWWLPHAATGIGWLDRRLPPAPPLRGTTDPRGRFQLEVPPSPALCLVMGPEGLGALVADASPDAPLQLVARPLGEVTRSDGRPLTGPVQLVADTPSAPFLPPRRGTSLALPAGDYLGWFGRPAIESAFHIDSAARLELDLAQPPAAAPPVLPPAPAGHAWIATGTARWPLTLPLAETPSVASSPGLPGAPDQVEAWLRGPHGIRLWTAPWPPRTADGPPGPGLGPGRWITCQLAATDADPGPETWLFSVALTTHREVRVLAVDRAAADGTCHALRDDPVDPTLPPAAHLVVWSPGTAPVAHAVPAEREAAATRLALPRPGPAQTARVRVLDADGTPLAGARVDLEPASDGEFLRRTRTTDSRGLARFSGLPTSTAATVVVTHPRHRPSRVVRAADASPDAESVVQLLAGLSILGRVFEPDGHPAAGVGVELRETTATTGTAPRRVATDASGGFRFDGLPEGLFTLFTSRQIGGTTWSAMRRGVQSGTGDEWRLDLRSEDPVPPGTRRDG